MSFQKMINELKRHIDARFDELEERLSLADQVDAPEAPEQEPEPVPIEALGLPSQPEAALIEAGYKTVDDLREASDKELAAIEGVGSRTIAYIRERVG